MKQHKQSEETGRRLWRRVLILPLYVCLVLASSLTHPVRSAGVSKEDRLQDQLQGHEVQVAFKGHGFMEGQVLDVQDNSLKADVTKSFNPGLISTGIQDIPIERISTVRWTAGSRNRKIFFTVGLVTGIVGGLWMAGSEGSLSGTKVLGLIGSTAGGGLLGYFVGSRMDQKSINFGTHRPMTGGRPGK